MGVHIDAQHLELAVLKRPEVQIVHHQRLAVRRLAFEMERRNQFIAIDNDVRSRGGIIDQAGRQFFVEHAQGRLALNPGGAGDGVDECGIVGKQFENAIHIAVRNAFKIRMSGVLHLLFSLPARHDSLRSDRLSNTVPCTTAGPAA